MTGREQAEAVFARFATPPCARMLGWRLIDADPEHGTICVGFDGKTDFCNPAGFVQGGFLAAMLDETMGPAVLVQSGGALFTPTIDLHVSFLAPARPGAFTGKGRVVRLGKSIAFLEADLFDGGDGLVARGTASARLVPAAKAVAAL